MLPLLTTKSFRKLVIQAASSVLILCFVVQELSFAAPEMKVSIAVPQMGSSAPVFPQGVAVVQDSFRGTSNLKVYLFQDAHTNFSAQKNIAFALRHLIEKEKVATVYLEGGFGNVSLTGLKRSAAEKKRQEVGLRYLRSGELSGVEYLNLTGETDFVLAGVEDRELYWRSLELYRTVAKDREKFKDYLIGLDRSIDALKPEVLQPLLRGFDRKRQDFLDGRLSFVEYFSALKRYAVWFDVPLADHPELSRMASLSGLEAHIDFKAANEEAVKAARFVQEKLPEAGKLTSLNTRNVEAFYALLEEKLNTVNEPHYPALAAYFEYLAKARAVKPAELLREQAELEAALLEKLAETPDEKRLLQAADRLRQWRALIDLSLLPNEFQALSGTDGLDLRSLTGFLNEKIMKLEDHYDRVTFLNDDFEKAIDTAQEFYVLTKKRDTLFVERMLARMTEKGESKAVLVAGGYHSPNLKQILKEKNISFLSVTPQVLNETNTARYEKLLLNQINSNVVASPDLPADVLVAGGTKFAKMPANPSVAMDESAALFGGQSDTLALLAVESRPVDAPLLTGARLSMELKATDAPPADTMTVADEPPVDTISLAEWIRTHVSVPARALYADYWFGGTHYLMDAITVFVNGERIDTSGKLSEIYIPVDSKVSLFPKGFNDVSGARLAKKSAAGTVGRQIGRAWSEIIHIQDLFHRSSTHPFRKEGMTRRIKELRQRIEELEEELLRLKGKPYRLSMAAETSETELFGAQDAPPSGARLARRSERQRLLEERILQETGAKDIVEVSLDPGEPVLLPDAAEHVLELRGLNKFLGALAIRRVIYRVSEVLSEQLTQRMPDSPTETGGVGDYIIYALREILKNAYVHGNRHDGNKPIYVHASVAGETVRVDIFDTAHKEFWEYYQPFLYPFIRLFQDLIFRPHSGLSGFGRAEMMLSARGSYSRSKLLDARTGLSIGTMVTFEMKNGARPSEGGPSASGGRLAETTLEDVARSVVSELKSETGEQTVDLDEAAARITKLTGIYDTRLIRFTLNHVISGPKNHHGARLSLLKSWFSGGYRVVLRPLGNGKWSAKTAGKTRFFEIVGPDKPFTSEWIAQYRELYRSETFLTEDSLDFLIETMREPEKYPEMKNILLLHEGRVVGGYNYVERGEAIYISSLIVAKEFRGTGAVDVLFEQEKHPIIEGHVTRDQPIARYFTGSVPEVKEKLGIQSRVTVKGASASIQGARLAEEAVWRNPGTAAGPGFDPKDFLSAQETLTGVVLRTPLTEDVELGALTGKKVFIKDEARQRAGSFKFRGVYHQVYTALKRILDENPEALSAGVKIVTQSTGNHGIAMIRAVSASVARLSGEYPAKAEELRRVEPVVFSYEGLKHVKLKEMVAALLEHRQKFGYAAGTLHVTARDYAEAKNDRIAYMAANSLNAFYMDHGGRSIMLGHGSMGIEIAQQLKERGIGLDKKVALVVPVGEGGPVGIGAAFKSVRTNVSFVLVQADGLDAFIRSLRTGKLERNEPSIERPTISDGIDVDAPDAGALRMAAVYADAGVVINESEAEQSAGEHLRSTLERAGGTTILSAGALLKFKDSLPEFRDADVIVLVNTEGNVGSGARLANGNISNVRLAEDEDGLARLFALRFIELAKGRLNNRKENGDKQAQFKVAFRGGTMPEAFLDYLASPEFYGKLTAREWERVHIFMERGSHPQLPNARLKPNIKESDLAPEESFDVTFLGLWDRSASIIPPSLNSSRTIIIVPGSERRYELMKKIRASKLNDDDPDVEWLASKRAVQWQQISFTRVDGLTATADYRPGRPGGPVLIMVHGLAGQGAFIKQLEELPEDVTVVALNRTPAPESLRREPTTNRLSFYTEDIAAAVRYFMGPEDLRRKITLVSHSAGSAYVNYLYADPKRRFADVRGAVWGVVEAHPFTMFTRQYAVKVVVDFLLSDEMKKSLGLHLVQILVKVIAWFMNDGKPLDTKDILAGNKMIPVVTFAFNILTSRHVRFVSERAKGLLSMVTKSLEDELKEAMKNTGIPALFREVDGDEFDQMYLHDLAEELNILLHYRTFVDKLAVMAFTGADDPHAKAGQHRSRVPMKVIAGKRDVLIVPEGTKKFADRVGAEYVEMGGLNERSILGGHHIPWVYSQDRDGVPGFNTELMRFVDGLTDPQLGARLAAEDFVRTLSAELLALIANLQHVKKVSPEYLERVEVMKTYYSSQFKDLPEDAQVRMESFRARFEGLHFNKNSYQVVTAALAGLWKELRVMPEYDLALEAMPVYLTDNDRAIYGVLEEVEAAGWRPSQLEMAAMANLHINTFLGRMKENPALEARIRRSERDKEWAKTIIEQTLDYFEDPKGPASSARRISLRMIADKAGLAQGTLFKEMARDPGLDKRVRSLLLTSATIKMKIRQALEELSSQGTSPTLAYISRKTALNPGTVNKYLRRREMAATLKAAKNRAAQIRIEKLDERISHAVRQKVSRGDTVFSFASLSRESGLSKRTIVSRSVRNTKLGEEIRRAAAHEPHTRVNGTFNQNGLFEFGRFRATEPKYKGLDFALDFENSLPGQIFINGGFREKKVTSLIRGESEPILFYVGSMTRLQLARTKTGTAYTTLSGQGALELGERVWGHFVLYSDEKVKVMIEKGVPVRVQSLLSGLDAFYEGGRWMYGDMRALEGPFEVSDFNGSSSVALDSNGNSELAVRRTILFRYLTDQKWEKTEERVSFDDAMAVASSLVEMKTGSASLAVQWGVLSADQAIALNALREKTGSSSAAMAFLTNDRTLAKSLKSLIHDLTAFDAGRRVKVKETLLKHLMPVEELRRLSSATNTTLPSALKEIREKPGFAYFSQAAGRSAQGARLAATVDLQKFTLGMFLAVPEGAGMPFALGQASPLSFRIDGARLALFQGGQETLVIDDLPAAVQDWKVSYAENKRWRREIGGAASTIRNTQKKAETLLPLDSSSRTGYLEIDLSQIRSQVVPEDGVDPFADVTEWLIEVLASRHGNYYLNTEGLAAYDRRWVEARVDDRRHFANFVYSKPQGMAVVKLRFSSAAEAESVELGENEYILRAEGFSESGMANILAAVAIAVEAAHLYEQGKGKTTEDIVKALNLSRIPQALADFSISGDRSSRPSARDVDSYFRGSMEHAQAWTIRAVGIFVKLSEAIRSALMVEISA